MWDVLGDQIHFVSTRGHDKGCHFVVLFGGCTVFGVDQYSHSIMCVRHSIQCHSAGG